MAGAFDRWAEMAEEAKEMRIKIARSLFKLVNRVMIAAFKAWADEVKP